MSRLEKEKHQKIIKTVANQYDDICKTINYHILKTSEIISKIYPLAILKYAFDEITAESLGKLSESEFTIEDALSRRTLDYSHCLIVSVQPSVKGYGRLTREIWKELKDHIDGIYTHLLPYFISTSAKRQLSGEVEDEYEEFFTKAQMYWCMVRGERHINHMTSILNPLLVPHNEIFENLFNISVSDFILELDKIRDALTKGLLESGYECKKAHAELFERLGPIEKIEIPKGMELKDFFNLKMEEFGLKEKFQKEAGRFLGYDLFDLSKVTKLPDKILEQLSWAPGETSQFFDDGEFKGWPLNLLPTWNRPFIQIDGKYYCFDLYVLSDKIYRSIQKMICRMEPGYITNWNERQKEVSEQLPFDLFLDLLPEAEFYKSIYYRWKTGKEKRPNWAECDGIIIYGDHIFIVEIKAGSFTFTPPATDFPAYISSIKGLILKPVEQGQRFKEYLLSEDVVDLYDELHNSIAEISHKQFRNITVCCLTVDNFTELAAQAQNIKNLGGGITGKNNWILSLDDLLVYKDFFKNPLQFLHFVEQRNKAYSSSLMNLEDELDHLALYLKYNCYVQYAEEIVGKKQDVRLFWQGMQKEIDEFYAKALVEKDVPIPQQEMPQLFADIIHSMAIKKNPHGARAASELLNMDSIGRNEYVGGIFSSLERTKENGRPIPFSLINNVDITTLCYVEGIEFTPAFNIRDHVYATMIIMDQKERILIEIYFNTLQKVNDIKVSLYSIDELRGEDLIKIKRMAKQLANDRLAKAFQVQGTIERNEYCPCGSGKKYKKCCLD